MKNDAKTTKTTKCPVCDWDIEKPIAVKHEGRTVNVCCQDCAEKLRAKA